MNKFSRPVLFLFLFLFVTFGSMAEPGAGNPCFGPVLSNGGFEENVTPDLGRPLSWYIGFEEEPLPSEAGSWALDQSVVAEGTHSLRLQPAEGMAVSQILHLPTGLLQGHRVSMEVWVRHDGVGEPPVMAVLALNPSLTDPVLGPGVAGGVVFVDAGDDGEWRKYAGSFVTSAPSNLVFVYLSAPGSGGTVWFDGVSVDTEPWLPQPSLPPANPEPPFEQRTFDLGFTTEGPMDLSELGRQCLLTTASGAADLVNVFFAVRWCRLGGDTCAEDRLHALDLERVRSARAAGLGVVLTFDFTHGQPEDAGSIGDLNPLPDGSSPGTLLDPLVRSALREELLWLAEQAQADVVIVGIEVDILGERHPDWWASFVDLERSIYNAIKAQSPSTHVTAYHRINWSVDEAGNLRPAAVARWRQLLGGIDSIAYSVYPNTAIPGLPVSSFPPGYFGRPADIAPELPIMVPEFGIPAGSISGNSQEEQLNALRTIVGEFIERDPVALIWFQLYDRLYIEAPIWAQVAFNEIGMHDLSGTPKMAFAWWLGLNEVPRPLPSPRRPGGRVGLTRRIGNSITN